MSVDSSGNQTNVGFSESASISADRRVVTFQSRATNLVANDTNNSWDIFVHELRATQPNDCISPTITASASTDSGADYVPDTWTNEDVKVTLSAQDNEGDSGLILQPHFIIQSTALRPASVVTAARIGLPSSTPL